MIKVENIETWGFKHAIRGMRNPMNSWSRSDTTYKHQIDYDLYDEVKIGNNDLELMKKLYKAGVEHRTYARLIQVSMDITAPLYWWKEADRYTVGRCQVSTSTMHCIHKKPFELDDFSHEHLEGAGLSTLQTVIARLNAARDYYNGKYDRVQPDVDKQTYWWEMIQLLPSSYNQKRTIMMSYEVVFKMIKERTGHRLDEWNDFVEVLKKLPYVREIMES